MLFASLAGCGPARDAGDDAGSEAARTFRPENGSVAGSARSNLTENGAQAAELLPDAMKGEAGARHVLGLWADALERGDWVTARAQWGDQGAMSGLSPQQYAARYTRYRQMKIRVARGVADAGAGSLFYTAPVSISGITSDGRPFAAKGTAYVRRVNDVEGASAEALRWHIERMDFGTGGAL